MRHLIRSLFFTAGGRFRAHPRRLIRRYTPSWLVGRLPAPAASFLVHRVMAIHPIAGGDGTDVMQKKFDEVTDTVKQRKQDAAEKWTSLEEARTKLGAVEGTPKKDSDEFKAFDEAGRAYDEVKNDVVQLEETRESLMQDLTRRGIVVEGEKPKTDPAAESLARPGQLPQAGKRITDSDEYKALVESGKLTSTGQLGNVPIGKAWEREEVKALLTGADSGSAGAFVEPDRIGYFPLPLRPITLLDLITIGETDSDLIEFVKMLTLTNAAAETAEAISAAPIAPRDGSVVTAVQGGRKPESAMTFTIEQEGVSTIAHWVPATKRALADAGQMRTIIDGALRWGLDDRVERQIVNGDGLGDNLLGLLQTTGMNAVPAGASSHADKVHFGMTQIRLDNFEPTGVAMNPIDAETVRLSRENADPDLRGGYLFGAPNSPGPLTLWGLPIAQSPAIPQGTALVGAFRAAVLWLREGAQILASDSHEDFFTRNLVAILAELRAGFGVPTPQAFAEVNLAAA